jgi:hypothetical protein
MMNVVMRRDSLYFILEAQYALSHSLYGCQIIEFYFILIGGNAIFRLSHVNADKQDKYCN